MLLKLIENICIIHLWVSFYQCINYNQIHLYACVRACLPIDIKLKAL